MKNYLHQCIEAHWQHRRPVLTVILTPLSWIFGLLVRCRYHLYRLGILKTAQAQVAVVVVGNIHVGGVGKTPIVAALANALKQQGRHVGIISRGYGRQRQDCMRVLATSAVADVGDEALMLLAQTQLPIVVGADRAAALATLCQQSPDLEIVISDDGLQHYALPRCLELVVMNADERRRFALLPDGPLREPLSRLKKADALLINQNNTSTNHLAFVPPIPCFQIGRQIGILYRLGQPQCTAKAEDFTNQRVMAAAAIACPERFFLSIVAYGIVVEKTLSLPDHTAFSVDEIAADYDALIVTEKDAVKLKPHPQIAVWVLPVYAIIPTSLMEWINQTLWP